MDGEITTLWTLSNELLQFTQKRMKEVCLPENAEQQNKIEDMLHKLSNLQAALGENLEPCHKENDWEIIEMPMSDQYLVVSCKLPQQYLQIYHNSGTMHL